MMKLDINTLNQPAYNKIADLDLAELEELSRKVIKEIRSYSSRLEKCQLRDEALLKFANQEFLKIYTDILTLQTLEDVHPEEKFRDLASKFVINSSAELSKINVNKTIFENYKNNIDRDKLNNAYKFAYDKIMLEFINSGANLSYDDRNKLEKLEKSISKTFSKFNRNIADNVQTIHFKEQELEGCYKEFIESNRKGDKIEIKLVGSNIMQILQNCSVKSTREKVKKIGLTYAKESNWDVLPDGLRLLEQKARLIGFNNYAELSMKDKMIENPKKAKSFIEDLKDLTKKRVYKEIETIKKKKEQLGDTTDLTSADLDYFSYQIASELAGGLNEEEIKNYFPYKHVKDSILKIFEDMFNIKFILNKTAKTWHKDVDVYDVKENNKLIGIIYLDMHPRKGKYTHACSTSLSIGSSVGIIPQNLLICNFNRPTKKSLGLQSLEEVTTFFHEFGHLLHSILGAQKQELLENVGTHVQRDFVEAPSQLLEEIIMDSSVLKKISKSVINGSSLPDNLIEKIKKREAIFDKARLKGIAIARQAALSEQSLLVFITPDINSSKLKEIEQNSVMSTIGIYNEEYYGIYDFGHLYGYYSNYYTYMWSLAISKDLFTKFNKKNLLDKKIADHYRKTILEPGGSKPAGELVKDFLGREWNMNAFKEYLKEGEELLA